MKTSNTIIVTIHTFLSHSEVATSKTSSDIYNRSGISQGGISSVIPQGKNLGFSGENGKTD